jgi:hypothetical protein
LISLKRRIAYAIFLILTLVTIKISVFWDVTASSLVKLPMFWKNLLPPFIEYPEEERSRFLQNVCNDLPGYTVSHPRKQ